MRNNSSGFSLVELLVALGLFATVAVSVATAFQQGISSWRRTEAATDLTQQARGFLDALARDLRNAVPFPAKALEGEPEGIRFHLVKSDAKGPQVIQISYRMTESENTHGVERTEQSMNADWPPRISFLPAQVSFEYAYEGNGGEQRPSWKSSWKDEKSLPPGIRTRLVLLERDGKPLEFSRTIGLPMGEWKEWKN